jgi:hypothetical protein
MKMLVKKAEGPGAVELIEEAVHLLRAVPAVAWAIYMVGAVPWVLGLGYFWATASWFAPTPEAILWRALGLVGLYIGLKVTQAEFCGRLRAVRLGLQSPPCTWRGLVRTAGRQARVQGWAALLLPVSALLMLPFAATWMFFENVTALAALADVGGETLEKRARREAMRWPVPAHVALLIFSGLGLCVWVNIATAFYAVPWLARTLLGAENLFGLSGWSMMNSTLLALVTILTWLAVDPLVKAYHVLRAFYGEAWHTGEDLRMELRAPKVRGGVIATARLAAILMMLGWLVGPVVNHGRASEMVSEVSPRQVDEALDEALRGRDFRWSLQPLSTTEVSDAADGWLKKFVREGFETIDQIWRDVVGFLEKLRDWIESLFGDKKEKSVRVAKSKDWGDFGAYMRVVLYGLLGLCAVALAWIVWVSWKKRPIAPRPLQALAAAPVAPDLNDEKLEASRLPSHEWLELARAQLARGEWRLALRALYLGSLASLAAQGLVSLARAKTNLDYERELARRAAGRTEVVTGFRGRRLSFECVWYGREEANETQVRAWLAELEREERRAI